MARGKGRGRAHGGGGEESEERWLLTYADMITLLMALFMVLFSISSVNISKVQVLQKSLRAAFSGDILPGGKAIAKPGAAANSSKAPTTVDVESIVPTTPKTAREAHSSSAASTHAISTSPTSAAEAQQEVNTFAHIKQQLDSYAHKHGFSSNVKTSIEPRGLVIRVLTDDLLFPSGQATLESSKAHALLGEIAGLLGVDQTHPIDVEGNTDNVPIHGGAFPSNWELSTARASTVVRFLLGRGVSPHRLTATGYADQHPMASNSTEAGRARNRRVEIVVKRIHGAETE